jgi:hypothetical protein
MAVYGDNDLYFTWVFVAKRLKANIEKWCNSFIDAMEDDGDNLDYSIESLNFIDEWIDSAWNGGQPNNIDSMVQVIGAYVGLTIEKIFPGIWSIVDDGYVFILDETESIPEGFEINPFGWVRKRFEQNQSIFLTFKNMIEYIESISGVDLGIDKSKFFLIVLAVKTDFSEDAPFIEDEYIDLSNCDEATDFFIVASGSEFDKELNPHVVGTYSDGDLNCEEFVGLSNDSTSKSSEVIKFIFSHSKFQSDKVEADNFIKLLSDTVLVRTPFSIDLKNEDCRSVFMNDSDDSIDVSDIIEEANIYFYMNKRVVEIDVDELDTANSKRLIKSAIDQFDYDSLIERFCMAAVLYK